MFAPPTKSIISHVIIIGRHMHRIENHCIGDFLIIHDCLSGCLYMCRASPVSWANSPNEVLITATTDTQNDISKQNWLRLTVGRA